MNQTGETATAQTAQRQYLEERIMDDTLAAALEVFASVYARYAEFSDSDLVSSFAGIRVADLRKARAALADFRKGEAK